MSSSWVVNASPLILLDKVDQAQLLVELSDELIIPAGVAAEVRAGQAGEDTIARLESHGSTRIESPESIPQRIAAWDLGRGESEVLAVALATRASRAVLDDLEARRCAQSLGVDGIGTLGVVLRAKRTGRVAAARPIVNRLLESGLYLSNELVEGALALVGEG